MDSAIIVQELVISMSKKKGKEGCMAIKIDLEKAYYHMEWSFIRDTLSLLRFPSSLSSLIMSCVTSFSIYVLFNGGALDPFLPSRGIRQGDPLSPYLFILCMEILGAFIMEKCEAKLWDPISASRGGVTFSHLFFVDDLVLFAKADGKNCRAIRDVLDTFCNLFGWKVSVEKSRAFFSPNVGSNTKEELCNILEFCSTPNLGKYLGAIVERVQNRLAGLKTHLLSFAGRVVLTKATLSTIPNYAMQCASLPSKVTQNIDRLCRNFIWGLTENKKKLHLIS